MKNSKKCPKCNSSEIAVTTGVYTGSANTILTGSTYFSAVPCDKYICLNCGYVEQWVHDDNGLKKITRDCEHYK